MKKVILLATIIGAFCWSCKDPAVIHAELVKSANDSVAQAQMQLDDATTEAKATVKEMQRELTFEHELIAGLEMLKTEMTECLKSKEKDAVKMNDLLLRSDSLQSQSDLILKHTDELRERGDMAGHKLEESEKKLIRAKAYRDSLESVKPD